MWDGRRVKQTASGGGFTLKLSDSNPNSNSFPVLIALFSSSGCCSMIILVLELNKYMKISFTGTRGVLEVKPRGVNCYFDTSILTPRNPGRIITGATVWSYIASLV